MITQAPPPPKASIKSERIANELIKSIETSIGPKIDPNSPEGREELKKAIFKTFQNEINDFNEENQSNVQQHVIFKENNNSNTCTVTVILKANDTSRKMKAIIFKESTLEELLFKRTSITVSDNTQKQSPNTQKRSHKTQKRPRS